MASDFRYFINNLYAYANNPSDPSRAFFANAIFKVWGAIAIIAQAQKIIPVEDVSFLLAPFGIIDDLPVILEWLDSPNNGEFIQYNRKKNMITIKDATRDDLLAFIPKGIKDIVRSYRIPVYKAKKAGKPYLRHDEHPFNEDPLPFTQIALTKYMEAYHFLKRKPLREITEYADLTYHLSDMAYSFICEDYNHVADVLTDIDTDYLVDYGHMGLALDWHKRIEGKITDQRLKAIQEAKLGLIHQYIGDMQTAIHQYELAIATNWEIARVYGVGLCLGNLANIYSDFGQIDRAIMLTQLAITCAESLENDKDRTRQLGHHQGNLGLFYLDLGDYATSITYLENAIACAKEIDNQKSSATWLGYWGYVRFLMGDVENGINSVKIALSTLKKSYEKSNIIHLVTVLWYHEGLQSASEILRVTTENYQDKNMPCLIWAMSGCIEFGLGNKEDAKTYFEQSITWADNLLKAKGLYEDQYARALAYVGLWCLLNKQDYYIEAQKTYRNARNICDATGILNQHRQMLTHLLSYAPERDGQVLVDMLTAS